MGWGAVVGGLAGGLLSKLGQDSANAQNLKIAREQMAFQERMSNTAYQRGMKDMRLAGLNPILAYSKGGASTPGGASANMVNSSAALGQAVTGMAQQVATVKQMEAQTKQLDNLSTKTAHEARGAAARATMQEIAAKNAKDANMGNAASSVKGLMNKGAEWISDKLAPRAVPVPSHKERYPWLYDGKKLNTSNSRSKNKNSDRNRARGYKPGRK